jgi:hypothetical protein
MKKTGICKKLIMLTTLVGMILLVASCGRGYVRGGYGYGRPYGYDYPRRPYRYAVPPPVVVVPRYCPPPRRGNGYAYGRRRWR